MGDMLYFPILDVLNKLAQFMIEHDILEYYICRLKLGTFGQSPDLATALIPYFEKKDVQGLVEKTYSILSDETHQLAKTLKSFKACCSDKYFPKVVVKFIIQHICALYRIVINTNLWNVIGKIDFLSEGGKQPFYLDVNTISKTICGGELDLHSPPSSNQKILTEEQKTAPLSLSDLSEYMFPNDFPSSSQYPSVSGITKSIDKNTTEISHINKTSRTLSDSESSSEMSEMELKKFVSTKKRKDVDSEGGKSKDKTEKSLKKSREKQQKRKEHEKLNIIEENVIGINSIASAQNQALIEFQKQANSALNVLNKLNHILHVALNETGMVVRGENFTYLNEGAGIEQLDEPTSNIERMAKALPKKKGRPKKTPANHVFAPQ